MFKGYCRELIIATLQEDGHLKLRPFNLNPAGILKNQDTHKSHV